MLYGMHVQFDWYNRKQETDGILTLEDADKSVREFACQKAIRQFAEVQLQQIGDIVRGQRVELQWICQHQIQILYTKYYWHYSSFYEVMPENHRGLGFFETWCIMLFSVDIYHHAIEQASSHREEPTQLKETINTQMINIG